MKNFLGVKILVIVYIILLMSSCGTKRSKLDQYEIIKTNNDIVSDWQDQKFSMFIHFGIYSIPGGIWDGNKITGYSEQIKGHAKIPTEEYRKLAHEFNPTLWNSDSIALLAKEAGMKSIVITAKHHDGFCMFDTKYSRFDIVDATPYKKDIIKEFVDACRKHNMRIGFYYSQYQDWSYPGAAGNDWDEPYAYSSEGFEKYMTGSFSRYDKRCAAQNGSPPVFPLTSRMRLSMFSPAI